MTGARFSVASCTVLACCFGTATCLAQTPSACGVTGGGVTVYTSYEKTQPPFSATVQITREQYFADGNAIHGQVVTHQYRDSAGRTRSEMAMGCAIVPDGSLTPALRVSVRDPIAKTSISWTVGDRSPKVARVLHQPAPPPAATPVVRVPVQRQIQPSGARFRNEGLGTRMIAGVLAEGSRSVYAIPAGEQGNDLPLETTTEVWIAQDTGIALLRVDDDPHNGRTTTAVTDLTFAEFAPALGYTLEEQVTRPVTTAAAH